MLFIDLKNAFRLKIKLIGEEHFLTIIISLQSIILIGLLSKKYHQRPVFIDGSSLKNKIDW